MIDVEALDALMAKRGMSRASVANALDIRPKSFCTWLNRGVLGSDIIDKLVELLEIDHPASIFFTEEVTCNDTNEKGEPRD